MMSAIMKIRLTNGALHDYKEEREIPNPLTHALDCYDANSVRVTRPE